MQAVPIPTAPLAWPDADPAGADARPSDESASGATVFHAALAAALHLAVHGDAPPAPLAPPGAPEPSRSPAPSATGAPAAPGSLAASAPAGPVIATPPGAPTAPALLTAPAPGSPPPLSSPATAGPTPAGAPDAATVAIPAGRPVAPLPAGARAGSHERPPTTDRLIPAGGTLGPLGRSLPPETPPLAGEWEPVSAAPAANTPGRTALNLPLAAPPVVLGSPRAGGPSAAAPGADPAAEPVALARGSEQGAERLAPAARVEHGTAPRLAVDSGCGVSPVADTGAVPLVGTPAPGPGDDAVVAAPLAGPGDALAGLAAAPAPKLAADALPMPAGEAAPAGATPWPAVVAPAGTEPVEARRLAAVAVAAPPAPGGAPRSVRPSPGAPDEDAGAVPLPSATPPHVAPWSSERGAARADDVAPETPAVATRLPDLAPPAATTPEPRGEAAGPDRGERPAAEAEPAGWAPPAPSASGPTVPEAPEAVTLAPRPGTPWLDQLADSIRLAGDQPSRSVRLLLQPEGLGSVAVRVAVGEGGVSVHLAVSHAATAELIQTTWPQLSQALQQQGLPVEHLALALAHGQAGGAGHQPPAPPPLPAPRRASRPAGRPDAAAHEVARALSRVDYRV